MKEQVKEILFKQMQLLQKESEKTNKARTFPCDTLGMLSEMIYKIGSTLIEAEK